MLLPEIPLNPLERGHLNAMRLTGGIFWTVAALVSIGPSFAISTGVDWFPLWAPPVVIALLGLWTVIVAVPRRWARWGWAWTGRELHVASGWLVRRHTIVPAARVQHIDVTQGPVERIFGIASLVLHTAGTANSEVDLPGITKATAEEIRDAIREQLTVDPW
ncbi:PH domain-containing protein [Sphingomonas suaedae]|nr:PH domain-containing protein [Sphingomonas suaedae]